MVHVVLSILAFILLAYLCLLALAAVLGLYRYGPFLLLLLAAGKISQKADQDAVLVLEPERQSFAFRFGRAWAKLIHAYRTLCGAR